VRLLGRLPDAALRIEKEYLARMSTDDHYRRALQAGSWPSGWPRSM
jgi:hypothetical protein